MHMRIIWREPCPRFVYLGPSFHFMNSRKKSFKKCQKVTNLRHGSLDKNLKNIHIKFQIKKRVYQLRYRCSKNKCDKNGFKFIFSQKQVNL